MRRLVTADVAAAWLQISPRTLSNWRAAGKVGQPPYVKVGRAVRYDLDAIKAWVARHTEGGESAEALPIEVAA